MVRLFLPQELSSMMEGIWLIERGVLLKNMLSTKSSLFMALTALRTYICHSLRFANSTPKQSFCILNTSHSFSVSGYYKFCDIYLLCVKVAPVTFFVTLIRKLFEVKLIIFKNKKESIIKYKEMNIIGFVGCVQDTMDELGVYILSFDRAGYGESDPNPNRSVKSEAYDIQELADQLRLGQKFYVIGMSIGTHPIWACLKYIPHRHVNYSFIIIL